MRRVSTTSDTYFNDLATCPPLGLEQERAMAAKMTELRGTCERLRAQGGQGLAAAERQLRAVRDRFVRANLRLVVKIAGRYAGGHLPFSDLIQEGNIGLITAVDRFEHERGVRFCTYATWWIRHRISRAIAHHGRAVAVPAHVAQAATKLQRQRRRIETQLGRNPSVEEVAAAAGIDAEHAHAALCATGRGLSLDARLRGDRTIADGLADDTTPSDVELADEEMRRAVTNALAVLQPLELAILQKRFDPADGEPMTLREIGAQHAISRERVRQLQNQALAKLKQRLTAA
jgi:RNA polymerase primary sigma factor